ncbi:Fic family protein [uncultured Meiothermus sp.]|uniref:Fic family protein n=1 Tax=uncultured Meiothermus sp. TaxID=157471 RepID=UPI00261B68D0|nr:Fic family protein [uncultured Meiothermus sp.]
MHRGTTGRYTVTSTTGEVVRAFIPNPLPPVPPLEFTPARQHLLERAHLALGRLDSITLLLPEPNVFLYAYVRREAVLSSQIEGTQSSLSDLLLFELEDAPGVPFEDVVEVSNYVAALEHGMARLEEGFPLSSRLIREMHEVLLSRGRGSGKSPGEFRRSQNWIGGTRPGNAHFVPPPPPDVQECMSALERFIHDEQAPYPTLVKAALAHVQFETIHPFLDGNGRIGRLLIAFILSQGAVLSRPMLYLSLYLKRYRSEYYRLLDLVRQKGDWETWVDFFLEGVEQTANNAVQTAQRLVGLFKEDSTRIQTLGRQTATALRVFDVLRERPLLSVGEVTHRTGLSFPTATKGIGALESLGIVEEITGQRRNRVFAYRRYLATLNEGTEPL